MKLSTKILSVAFVVAIALAITATASAAIVSNLTVGSTGAEVAELQATLVAGGYLTMPAGVNPGYFGALTKAAVIKYQIAKGITPAAGYVGPITRASLAAAPATGGTTGGTTGGKLEGTAGDATVTETQTDVESTAIEGESTKVHGFKVDADGSDIEITSLKVSFLADGTSNSSYRLNHYVDSVDVYEGSKKVGSADVSDFNKSGNTYSKSIALSDAIVREGSSNKKTFYVVVNAIENIDSVDFNANWTLTVSNIRFEDAEGAILTATYSETSTFDFSSLAAQGDAKVTVSKGSNNPVAGQVEVSDTGSTKDVLMLEFKVKTGDSDVSFDTLQVTATSTQTSGSIKTMVGELQLRQGSDVLATIDGSDLTSGTAATFNLDDTFNIDANSTETFRVYATINDSTNFGDAGTLVVGYHDGADAFAPEDANGDTINPTGSAVGEIQSFVVNGSQVQFVSSTYTAPNVTDKVDGTISMTFKVSALGDNDITLAQDQFGTSKTSGVASQSAGAGIVVFNVTGATTTDAVLDSSNITKDGSNNFTISAGDTGTFTLTVKLSSDGTTGFVRMTITNVNDTAVANTVQTPAY